MVRRLFLQILRSTASLHSALAYWTNDDGTIQHAHTHTHSCSFSFPLQPTSLDIRSSNICVKGRSHSFQFAACQERIKIQVLAFPAARSFPFSRSRWIYEYQCQYHCWIDGWMCTASRSRRDADQTQTLLARLSLAGLRELSFHQHVPSWRGDRKKGRIEKPRAKK